MTAASSLTLSATPAAVADTARAIEAFVRRTPIVAWTGDAGAPRTTLKLESMQHAGSFKTRGAFANLLMRPARKDGVVAASGGNHGAAVAYAAQRLGMPATIFVPSISSPAKIERIRGYGADLVITGNSYGDALAASQAWSEGRDVLAIHAFDQLETILGQGTLAREIEDQVPDAGAVLVPVGGGGLLAGVAAWYGRRVRVIGVEPVSAPTLTRALEAGRPVDADAGGIAADSLAPPRVGELVYDVVRAVIDGVVLVSEDEIRAAQRHLWSALRVVAEPGGATAFAALLSGKVAAQPGDHIVVAITGGNTTAVQFT
jgi:threonine dehydratase